MPGPKVFCKAVRLNHWLVVLGGISENGTGGDRCRKVFAFNTLSREWTQWQATPYASCAAASTGSHLYVAGGCPPDGGKAVGDVCQLNDSHDEWNVISTLPFPRFDCAATILTGKLYVAGSIKEDARSNVVESQPSRATSVQVLDLQTDTWSVITMLASQRSFCSNMKMTRLVALGHLLITDRFTTYDVVTKKSGDLPPLPETSDSASHAAMAVVNNRLLVWEFDTRKVYVLSEDRTHWSSLPNISKDHTNGALCTVNSRVYAVGGQTYSGSGVFAIKKPMSSFECFE